MDDKDYGIPAKLKVRRRPYTMSPEALEARRQNAQKSTGPKTDEGKKASSRNSWKHGLYARTFILGTLGKPCKTTCDKFPCGLVSDNEITPGETCLDKQFVAEAFDSIIRAVEMKEHEDFNHLAVLEMAGAIQVLRRCKEDILEDGVVLKSEKIDKDGNSLGYEYKPHPALAVYTKLLSDLGLTPQEFNITPREIARTAKNKDEEERETAADIMARALGNLARRSGGE
ncbi:MAG: hypothetical protein ACE5GY_08545 [Thermodesulfobacteriota bacterium]